MTALYQDQKRRGLLRTDLPLQECHGQTKLAYHHPAFSGDEPEAWMKKAFRQDYEANSSSMLRMVETAIRGYEHLAVIEDRDAVAALGWTRKVVTISLDEASIREELGDGGEIDGVSLVAAADVLVIR